MSLGTNRLLSAALGCSLFVLGGCTTVTRSFPNSPAYEVWAAMVEVAEHPQYKYWNVDSNNVTIDEPTRRIGVFRRLSRVVRGPGKRRYHEERHWRFDIRLEEFDPPGALFVSRGWGVPQQAVMEADLYFAGVQQWLDQVGKAGHRSETQDPQPQTQDRILEPDND